MKTKSNNITSVIDLKFWTLLISFLLCGCTDSDSHTDFRVGIRTIPDKFDPRNNEVNVFHYINSHLFYPLFTLGQFGKIESNFVDLAKSKPTDSSFTKYDICLKKDVTFSDFTKIKIENLKQAITAAHSRNLELPNFTALSANLNCISVTLSRSEPKYFNKLTSIDSTILKEEFSKKSKMPMGKGPFKIVSLSENELNLERTETTSNSKVIKKITFVKVDTPEEGTAKGIHDWNHLWQHLGNNAPIPNEIKNNWRKFEQTLLRSLMVVVHIDNLELRRKFRYCFNSQKYIDSVGFNIIDVPGLLPSGLFGSNVSFKEIKKTWSIKSEDCNLPSNNAKEVPFYLFYPSLEKQVASFLKSVQPFLPIKLNLKIIPLKEAISELFSNNELVMVSLDDTMRISPTGFFTPFIGATTAIPKIVGLEKGVREAALANDPEIADSMYAKVHKMLLETGSIIPLGQVRATYYYPPFIKSIPYVEPANGYPQLDKVEVY